VRQSIDSICRGVPGALKGVITRGQTLTGRADVLAYFRPSRHLQRTTEVIKRRLDHLRGPALPFRNLTNYIARSLLNTGGFRPQLHPRL
jgi:hypothetical protein